MTHYINSNNENTNSKPDSGLTLSGPHRTPPASLIRLSPDPPDSSHGRGLRYCGGEAAAASGNQGKFPKHKQMPSVMRSLFTALGPGSCQTQPAASRPQQPCLLAGSMTGPSALSSWASGCLGHFESSGRMGTLTKEIPCRALCDSILLGALGGWECRPHFCT